MKKDIIKKIYFQGADDKNLEKFTKLFLQGGLLWIYIALNPEKLWDSIFKKLKGENRRLFISEYNKAFLFTKTYRELTKLFLGKEIALKNIFLPHYAETTPDRFLKFNRSDDLRWKEALELIS